MFTSQRSMGKHQGLVSQSTEEQRQRSHGNMINCQRPSVSMQASMMAEQNAKGKKVSRKRNHKSFLREPRLSEFAEYQHQRYQMALPVSAAGHGMPNGCLTNQDLATSASFLQGDVGRGQIGGTVFHQDRDVNVRSQGPKRSMQKSYRTVPHIELEQSEIPCTISYQQGPLNVKAQTPKRSTNKSFKTVHQTWQPTLRQVEPVMGPGMRNSRWTGSGSGPPPPVDPINRINFQQAHSQQVQSNAGISPPKTATLPPKQSPVQPEPIALRKDDTVIADELILQHSGVNKSVPQRQISKVKKVKTPRVNIGQANSQQGQSNARTLPSQTATLPPKESQTQSDPNASEKDTVIVDQQRLQHCDIIKTVPQKQGSKVKKSKTPPRVNIRQANSQPGQSNAGTSPPKTATVPAKQHQNQPEPIALEKDVVIADQLITRTVPPKQVSKVKKSKTPRVNIRQGNCQQGQSNAGTLPPRTTTAPSKHHQTQPQPIALEKDAVISDRQYDNITKTVPQKQVSKAKRSKTPRRNMRKTNSQREQSNTGTLPSQTETLPPKQSKTQPEPIALQKDTVIADQLRLQHGKISKNVPQKQVSKTKKSKAPKRNRKQANSQQEQSNTGPLPSQTKTLPPKQSKTQPKRVNITKTVSQKQVSKAKKSKTSRVKLKKSMSVNIEPVTGGSPCSEWLKAQPLVEGHESPYENQTVTISIPLKNLPKQVDPESLLLEESPAVLEYVSTQESQESVPYVIQPLTCHICVLSFHNFDRYMQHKWSHRSIRRRCSRHSKQCAKKPKNKKQLSYVLIHQNARPFMCEFCGKNFVRRRDVTVHLRIHTGEKPFVCTLCNKGFSQNSQLKRHLVSHVGGKPFSCEVCGNRYSRKDGLKRHMVTHSGLRPYSCHLCSATFTYSSTLGEHMAQHRGDRPHKCQFCPQTFIKKIRLIEHERIHTGYKPFTCDICNAGFTAARLLNSHKKIHAEKRPFTCDVCNKGFTQRGALTKHMVCHSDEKPWTCEECGKGFGQQQYLKNHMKVHSDVKPYKCVHCGWGFRDKTSHIRHERLHTGVRPYKCDRCDKSFNRSNHLKRHLICHEKYAAKRIAIQESTSAKVKKE